MTEALLPTYVDENETTPLKLFDESEQADEHSGSGPVDLKHRAQSFTDGWHWYHTLTVLLIRVMIDFTFKNPLVFYLNYVSGLGIDYLQFAYILIAADLGCMFAIFMSDASLKWIGSRERIMELSLLLAGVAQILTPAFTYFGVVQDHELYNIIWCCVMRFLVGVSFAFISAASIEFSHEFVSRPSKTTAIISIMHYSWPISTLFNILAGYLILDSWMMVFILSGVLLILTSIIAKCVFYYYKLPRTQQTRSQAPYTNIGILQSPLSATIATDEISDGDDYTSDPEQQNSLTLLFTDLNSLLIIFTSFFMTFRSRTIYIVTSSLWMEMTYGLSSASLGWTTVTVIVGEVAGLTLMVLFSHKYKTWTACLAALLHQLVFGTTLFVMSIVFGNDIPLWLALVLMTMLTMGHEAFYVVQQTNALHYAPTPDLKFQLLLGERMSQEMASVVTLLVTVWLWNKFAEDAILVFSVIWIGATLVESLIMLIYTSEPTHKKDDDTLAAV